MKFSSFVVKLQFRIETKILQQIHKFDTKVGYLLKITQQDLDQVVNLGCYPQALLILVSLAF